MTIRPRPMLISGFTLVRNASRLDFPLEASIRSLLPAVDELVINVGRSTDDTLQRVHALADRRIRILESDWDPGLGTGMLAVETMRAMRACRHPWGIYIQADEVFVDGGAERLRAAIARVDGAPHVEGVVVDYRHFYGGFDSVATNRSWYRREVRAIRLDPALEIHSYRDAQGFRVGPAERRVRAVLGGVRMHHYGWARPTWALAAKRVEDRALDPARRQVHDDRPLLPWFPGIRPFTGEHPVVARDWIAARRSVDILVAPRKFEREHLQLRLSATIERATGWRPFEFRNYTLVRG